MFTLGFEKTAVSSKLLRRAARKAKSLSEYHTPHSTIARLDPNNAELKRVRTLRQQQKFTMAAKKKESKSEPKKSQKEKHQDLFSRYAPKDKK
jgi:hypothetical protein